MAEQSLVDIPRRPYGHSYPPLLNHLTEADLLRGYAGLAGGGEPSSRDPLELQRAEIAAHADGDRVPESLLLRGRRCPCGAHR